MSRRKAAVSGMAVGVRYAVRMGTSWTKAVRGGILEQERIKCETNKKLGDAKYKARIRSLSDFRYREILCRCNQMRMAMWDKLFKTVYASIRRLKKISNFGTFNGTLAKRNNLGECMI